MKPILCLVKHDRLRPVNHLSGLLLTTHGGQAVHEVGVRRGVRHKVRCHLVRLEGCQALGGRLASDAIGHPRVGVHNVSTRHRLLRRLEDSGRARARHALQLRALGERVGLGEELGGRRRGHAHVHSHDNPGAHQVVGYVVARVARIGQRHSREVEGALLFGDRLEVREHLHRVRKVIERVNDGDGRVRGKAIDLATVVHARGHGVHHARQHRARILIGLLLADRRVARHVRDGVTTHLRHARLERDPRAKARLLEEHEERLALEHVVVIRLVRLHVNGQGQDRGDLCPREVRDLRDVAEGHGGACERAVGR
mmetsp:Transcript_66386/g.183339  ORF Transcript_66386/g.183339 Transcript_66386/m.183339 type:complete len:312 (-) Transcript_66386:135-1070(-)